MFPCVFDISRSGTRCLLSAPCRSGCFLCREVASVVCSFEKSCREGNRSSQASNAAFFLSPGSRGLLRADVEIWSSVSGTDVGFVGLSIDRRRAGKNVTATMMVTMHGSNK